MCVCGGGVRNRDCVVRCGGGGVRNRDCVVRCVCGGGGLGTEIVW